MINRPNVIAAALCVLFVTSLGNVQAQFFKKKSEPTFKTGKDEKKGFKLGLPKPNLPILNSFPNTDDRKDASASVPEATTTTFPDQASIDVPTLETTNIVPEKKRRLKLPSISIPKIGKKDPIIPAGETQTLINQDGELVEPGKKVDTVVFKPESKPTTTSSPSREVDGTVIYDKWSDVVAYRPTAADKIVWQLKAQEAEHNRKRAAQEKALEAKLRQAEAQMKKAQEEHRRKVLLQQQSRGGGLPLGIPGGGF